MVDETAVAAGMMGYMFVMFLASIVMIVALWKLYAKAEKPGWASIVPIYNLFVMLEMIGKPAWWIILFFIPGANAVVGILMTYHFVKCFGKPGSHVLLALFFGLIYFPYLAFSSAAYTAPETAA